MREITVRAPAPMTTTMPPQKMLQRKLLSVAVTIGPPNRAVLCKQIVLFVAGCDAMFRIR